MPKLMGNLRITAVPASSGGRAHFELLFQPYTGRVVTQAVSAGTYDDLVALLMELKLSEDESTRWAGKARSQGLVLIDSFERTDALLREKGLLA
ncbi:MAG TPA: hypothetical protein VL967_14210 [Terracidiphilus sp.]|nr:hypothetical protein [Terracidiphilus sp.]